MFLVANSVADYKHVAVLPTVIGVRNYALLKDLLFPPEEVKAKSLNQIGKALIHHIEPESLVIAECFQFYRRMQEKGELQQPSLLGTD